MFKRSGAIVLTMLYIVTVLGFALNLHYCGKIITSVKINVSAKSCIKDITAGKMKCCKDKQFKIKIKDEHQSEARSFLSKMFGFELAQVSFAHNSLFAQQILLEEYFDKGPPDRQPSCTSVFLKNCTFRI